MRKTLLLSLTSCLALSAAADFTAPGYYRVENYKTQRYVSVIDNRGRIDIANTTADLQAIQLQKDFNEVCCDPASILYVTPKGGNEYQIDAQGTGIHQIIQHYVKLSESGTSGGQKLYKAYGEMSGVVKYLGDSEFFPTDLGVMATNASGDYTKWFILPIDANSNNWFGVRTTVSAGGKHYATMYGSFSYSPYSSGIKSYYVKNVENGIVVIDEISGTVPSDTPVIIECSSTEATNNRLNIGGSASAVSGNKLKGVYFCNHNGSHINRVEYDKNTMRVLGTCSDGRLGFVTATTLQYLPKNTAYITVPAGSPAQYPVMTQAEYDNYAKTLPTSVALTPATLTMTEGESTSLTVNFTPANATGATLTWSTSNASVATVSNGVVKAVAPGSATITLTTSNGKSATCAVTVYKNVIAPTAITLSQTTLTLTEGESGNLTATITPSNATDKSVTWTSANSAVATVANGKVTAISAGTTTITAKTYNGLTATCAVTVNKPYVAPTSITLDLSNATMLKGESKTLSATVLPADATDKSVTWSSSNTNVLQVTANGVITAVNAGTATVTATTVNGLKATCQVKVPEPYPTSISLNVPSVSLKCGSSFTLVATLLPNDCVDKSLTWSSSNPEIAAVNASGVVSFLKPGQARVTATTANGLTAGCDVTVQHIYPESFNISPSKVEMKEGEELPLVLSFYPENTTARTIEWTVANPSVASVSAEGVISSLAVGETLITGKTVNGYVATVMVYVKREVIPVETVTISPESLTIKMNEESDLTVEIYPANATDKTITWTSSNIFVASVENGHVNGISMGLCTITAMAPSGAFSVCDVRVNDLNSVDGIISEGERANVYDLSGRLVIADADAEALGTLAPGIYIVNGRKLVVK